MSITDHSEPVPAEFDLGAWIDGATVSMRSLKIHGRPDLYAVAEDLERRLKALDAEERLGQVTAGDTRRRDIQTEMTQIYDLWAASATTWFVAALPMEKIEEIRAAFPVPDEVAKTADMDDAAYLRAVEEWETANRAAINEQNLALVAAAVDRVESPSGATRRGISVEELRRMREKLGDRQMLLLVNAAAVAAMSEPDLIPASFSQRTSVRTRA